jgi:hypothetical protein
LDLQLAVLLVPIATKAVSSIPTQGEVYLIQHNVKKFVNDLQQVDGFLRVLQLPPPIKLTAMIYTVTEILLKVAFNIITLTVTSIRGGH